MKKLGENQRIILRILLDNKEIEKEKIFVFILQYKPKMNKSSINDSLNALRKRSLIGIRSYGSQRYYYLTKEGKRTAKKIFKPAYKVKPEKDLTDEQKLRLIKKNDPYAWRIPPNRSSNVNGELDESYVMHMLEEGDKDYFKKLKEI